MKVLKSFDVVPSFIESGLCLVRNLTSTLHSSVNRMPCLRHSSVKYLSYSQDGSVNCISLVRSWGLTLHGSVNFPSCSQFGFDPAEWDVPRLVKVRVGIRRAARRYRKVAPGRESEGESERETGCRVLGVGCGL